MSTDDRARMARDVGIESVVEQQRLGGRMPSQREAEDYVAAILPRAIDAAQAGVAAAASKSTATKAPSAVAAGIQATDDAVSCDIDFSTGKVSNVVESASITRARIRESVSTSPEAMCVHARVKLLFQRPEWCDRIKRCGNNWEKFRKILDDSNAIPGLGRWDAGLSGPERAIFSGAGGKR